MTNKLIAEILKAQDALQDIQFDFAGETYKFYFRYLTLLEKARIEQMSVKINTIIKDDGTKEIKYEKQDHIVPIHTIIEKALDENGKRLFSHTNSQHFDIISKLPAGLASYIAYQMSSDIMGTFKDKKDGE